MQLEKGKTKDAMETNIARLQAEGFTREQAISISYSKAGKPRPKKLPD